MFHTSKIELSRSALKRNIGFLKKRIGRQVRFTSVVKGNAYGHGLDVFVRLAEDCGVRSFAVFSADEALQVIQARTHRSDVLIMGAIDRLQLDWAVENKVAFYVFNLQRLRDAVDASQRISLPARVHLDLETGMHRLGLEQSDLEAAAGIINENPDQVKLEGLCTHYAGAESVSNYLRIHEQIAQFNELCDWLERAGLRPTYRHTACSASALVYPETIMDMVRIGIAQYGYWPSEEVKMRIALEKEKEGNGPRRWTDPLKRVITWKSRVMAVKRVKAGEFIGYGTNYLANSARKIAIIPVGYADGFTRRLSNMGRVLIRGRRFAVIGAVNMNMMIVDVTEAPDIGPGDEVVLIGKQKKNVITVASFSEMSQFLNYEMLVRLPREIPRVVVP